MNDEKANDEERNNEEKNDEKTSQGKVNDEIKTPFSKAHWKDFAGPTLCKPARQDSHMSMRPCRWYINKIAIECKLCKVM